MGLVASAADYKSIDPDVRFGAGIGGPAEQNVLGPIGLDVRF
jgi:hypothetical protein